jgi:hypothetical protein
MEIQEKHPVVQRAGLLNAVLGVTKVQPKEGKGVTEVREQRATPASRASLGNTADTPQIY